MFMKEREYAFYQWSLLDLERHFEVKVKEGLSSRQSSFRLQKYGPNSIDQLYEVDFFEILLRQFNNFFVWILVAAAVISYFVDGIFQSLVIFLIVTINITLGFFQEYKAEKALGKLKEMFKSSAKVLRDGEIRIIQSYEIALGDVVFIEAGDRVPADLRLLEVSGLKIDESSLTGESLPVEKQDGILPIDTMMADQTNMLFGSTVAVAGSAKGLVVAIGADTQFGKIAEAVKKNEDKTPLEKQITYLAKNLTVISFILVAILFYFGYLRHYELLPLLTFVIALLISAVPESLPTVITLALAIGVGRMAKRKAIVRRLAVIETLGTTNIIATDKTGTLTKNQLSVNSVSAWAGKKFTDYNLENRYQIGKEVETLFRNAVICSSLNLVENKLTGDPVEVSIAETAKSMEKGVIADVKRFRKTFEVPFDSDNKYMAVAAEREGEKILIVKGAVEELVRFCLADLSDRKKILEKARILSKKGLKVIGVAYKIISKNGSSALSGLIFEGLIGLVDEPAFGVKEAIEKTIAAGIRPIMLTGDHVETAKFIADRVGLNPKENEIINGKELEKMTESELEKALLTVKVFARISPTDKSKIVEILQKAGYSVAVTGDGINDAPALKEANVGIAMGQRGTDAAKDSADIVLLDDRYLTIVSAIEYGRAVYDNIRNAVTFLISGNLDELFLVGVAFIFDLPMPLLTLQILWINMLTDSLPAMALAFEHPSVRILNEKPRSAKSSSMRVSIYYAVCLGLVGLIFGLVLFLWGLNFSVDKARTLVFSYVVLGELAYVLSIRSKERIWQNVRSFFANKLLIISIIIALIFQTIVFIPPISKIFGVVLLEINEIIILILLAVLSFFLAEILRYFFDRKSK